MTRHLLSNYNCFSFAWTLKKKSNNLNQKWIVKRFILTVWEDIFGSDINARRTELLGNQTTN